MLIRKVITDSHYHVFPAMKYECSCLLTYCVNSSTPGNGPTAQFFELWEIMFHSEYQV